MVDFIHFLTSDYTAIYLKFGHLSRFCCRACSRDGDQNDRHGVVNWETCHQKMVMYTLASVSVAGIEAQSYVLIIHTSKYAVNITSLGNLHDFMRV